MAAFSLALAIFFVWSLIGWPLVSSLNGCRNLIRNALLAPVAGAAAVMLAVFECNRWGLPVRACGPVVTMVCGMLAAAAIWRFRFPLPWRQLAPFLGILAIGAPLVGYPMLLHGFDWISYANDDMANYVLGAGAFLQRGYLDSFDPRLILESRDMGLAQWLPIILSGVRCGCELTLAWVMSLTGLSGHQVFMPVIVALHLALVCAAGAMVARNRNNRLAALVTCAWMAVCSLVALGTVYQLIAQVFGLGLLAGAGVLLLEPSRREPWPAALKRSLLAALFCASLGVAYPELLPFLAASFGLAHLVALARRREAAASLVRTVAVTGGVTVLLWNTFADSVPTYLYKQARTGLRTAALADMLFPYYLVPSGLATFWGWAPIARPMGRPLLDIAIAAGAILLAFAVLAAFRQAWFGQPAAALAVVMLALAVRLVSMRSDFGLYKLAMYIQPFLIGSLVLAWFAGVERKTSGKTARMAARLLPIAIVAGLGFPAQLYYVGVSAGSSNGRGGFVEIPEASSRRLVSQLRSLAQAPDRGPVVSDTSNIVLAKLEATYFAPARQMYPARDFFTSPGWEGMRLVRWYADLVRPGYVTRSYQLLLQWHAMQARASFDMQGGPPNPFHVVGEGGEAGGSLLVSGPVLSVLNRGYARRSTGSMVALVASEQARNHLIQVDSELGKNYYLAYNALGEGRVAMFQLEPDYFYSGGTFSAVGRVILFQVLHHSPGFRLAMEYTASLQADGQNRIPPAQAIGMRRSPFGAGGRGSARLFSAPLEPQTIAGRQYVAIDMGAAGKPFVKERSGLMRWFGASVPLDSRRITGFVRDLSAIASEDYDALRAPANVSAFPADLAQKTLEYSGIYEDGWVAEDSFLFLRKPARPAVLTVRAAVPALEQRAATLQVLADGKRVAQASLHAGDNEVQALLDGPAARSRIDLRFDVSTPLPAPDGRPVSARLKFVGFRQSAATRVEIADPPINLGNRWYPFELFDGQTFRWVENDARLEIAAPGPQTGELAIDLEPGPGMGGKPVALHLVLPDGSTRVLPAVTGRQVRRIPLALEGGVNPLALRVIGGGLAIAGDPRKLNFRVFALTWTPDL